MYEITIGTTPTIIFFFKQINPKEINSGIFTVSRYKMILLQKDLSSAIIEDDKISFDLTQEETINIGTGNAELLFNYTINGVRATSKKKDVKFISNPIVEVM